MGACLALSSGLRAAAFMDAGGLLAMSSEDREPTLGAMGWDCSCSTSCSGACRPAFLSVRRWAHHSYIVCAGRGSAWEEGQVHNGRNGWDCSCSTSCSGAAASFAILSRLTVSVTACMQVL